MIPETCHKFALAAVVAAALCVGVAAEEGMWTFDAAPLAKINAALGTSIDQAWLDKVQAASVRLSGCSASVVSPDGLVLTNQHCVRACLQTFSTPDRDRLAEGFFTASRPEERTCPGQTAEILLSIEDVTARISRATTGRSGGEFVRARSAEQSAIEKAGCGADPRLRCQVVTLHRGGQYKLYRYRRYADVRLVYVPEHQAVVFGGDPDNFNFPRFALDAAFLRLYDEGRPAATPAFLQWTPRAPLPGEPVFVAGNPGSTSRLETVAQLETARDVVLPSAIKRYSELRGRLLRFAAESQDHRRMTRDAIRGTENNLKRTWGQHQTLADPSFLEAKRSAERELVARSGAGTGPGSVAEAIEQIAAAQRARRELLPAYRAARTAGGGIVGALRVRANPRPRRGRPLEAERGAPHRVHRRAAPAGRKGVARSEGDRAGARGALLRVLAFESARGDGDGRARKQAPPRAGIARRARRPGSSRVPSSPMPPSARRSGTAARTPSAPPTTRC